MPELDLHDLGMEQCSIWHALAFLRSHGLVQNALTSIPLAIAQLLQAPALTSEEQYHKITSQVDQALGPIAAGAAATCVPGLASDDR